MSNRVTRWSVVFALAASAFACSKDNPAQPSSPATTTTTAATPAPLTASVTAPLPVAPGNGAQIRNVDQPVTLVIENAVITKSDPVTYTFEVASDAAFATKVVTKDVAQSTGPQTSLKLDALAAAKDYWWHARASGGGTTGVFSGAYKFTIGPAIVINTPVPVSPAAGATVASLRPTFTVTNATRQGPAGPITYRFEIAGNEAFSPVLIAATVGEAPAQTSFRPSTPLESSTTYYWRVTAIDGTNGLSSAATSAQLFKTPLSIDLSRVIVVYPAAPSGPEVASWPETGSIISVEQDGNPAANGPMCVAFSTSTDWPSIAYFGDPDVQIYANQWYFANINGQWYGGPGEYLRVGRGFCKTGQGTNAIGPDGGWNEPMRSWVPKVGEMVGYMMSTPARNWPGMHSTNERSNIVVQPWVDSSQRSTASGIPRR